jgi:hypothetical protein
MLFAHSNEIGSEFWATDNDTTIGIEAVVSLDKSSSKRWLMSGRTALDAIIKDAIINYDFDTVWMPAYCCHSMVDPFTANGIHVEYYGVSNEEGKLILSVPEIHEQEALFVMQYFGYERAYPKNVIRAKNNNRLIIEDHTHNWYKDSTVKSIGDYTFISYRKWGQFTGIALAQKTIGDFSIPEPLLTNRAYVDLRNNAALLKRDYIRGECTDKDIFLEQFALAEELLDGDYSGYAADQKSYEKLMDFNEGEMISARRSNAETILQGINKLPFLTPIFPELTPEDIPLFVPVLLPDIKVRDELKRYFVERNIYCPVHWPKHCDACGHADTLFERELSLLCDQRYGKIEMNKILKMIHHFAEENSLC